jgi:integrase
VSDLSDVELFDAFTTYQQGRAFSPRTVKRRATSLRSLAGFMAPLSVREASPEDLDVWLSRLGAPKTRHAYRSDVSVFFRWAVKRRLLEHDPVALTDSIRLPKALPRPVPPAVLDEALRTGSGRVQLALLLGALAGLRAGEIAALDASDVQLDADPPILIVRDGKGAKDRIVPVHPMLARHLDGRHGLLFPGLAGGHVTAGTMSALLARVLTRAGGGSRRYSAHMLRHFFGTEAARWSGGNVVLVGKLLGHESPTTTMGYIGWSPTEGAAVVSKINPPGAEEDELARRRVQRGA